MSTFTDNWFKTFKSWLYRQVYSKSGIISRLDRVAVDEVLDLFKQLHQIQLTCEDRYLFLEEFCFALSFMAQEDRALLQREYLKSPLIKDLDDIPHRRLKCIPKQLPIPAASESHLTSLAQGLRSQILLAVVENDTGDMVYLLKMARYLRNQGYAAPKGQNLGFIVYIAEFVSKYADKVEIEERQFNKNRVDSLLKTLKAEFPEARFIISYYKVEIPAMLFEEDYSFNSAFDQTPKAMADSIADWRLASILWVISSVKPLFEFYDNADYDWGEATYDYLFSSNLNSLLRHLPSITTLQFLGELFSHTLPPTGLIRPSDFQINSVHCSVHNFGFFSRGYNCSTESRSLGFMPSIAEDTPKKTIDPYDINERLRYLNAEVLQELYRFTESEQNVLRFIVDTYSRYLKDSPHTYLVLLQVGNLYAFEAVHRVLNTSREGIEFLVISMGEVSDVWHRKDLAAEFSRENTQLAKRTYSGLDIYFLRNGLSYQAQKLLSPVVNVVFADGDNAFMNNAFSGITVFPTKKFSHVGEGFMPALIERFDLPEFKPGLESYQSVLRNLLQIFKHFQEERFQEKSVEIPKITSRLTPELIKTFWLLAQHPDYSNFLQERFVATVDRVFSEPKYEVDTQLSLRSGLN